MNTILFFVTFNICLFNYFIIRLYWLKRFQMVVLLRSPVIYVHLPSLSYMLWRRWWVWTERSFLPEQIGFEDLRPE